MMSWRGDVARRRANAFTVLELLAVIFVIGLLLAILIPSFTKAREAARRTVCVAHLKSIGSGLFTYAYDNEDLGPQVMKEAGTMSNRSWLSRSGRYVNLGLLLEKDAAGNPDIFFCPSQEEFFAPSNTKYLPAGIVGGSYAYAVHIPAEQSPRLGAVRHLALASDDFVARLTGPGVGRYSHKTGYNVLYTDGSASWYPDPEEKIWQRGVHWDNEKDDVTYDTLYEGANAVADGSYGNDLDVFRVWYAFCYNVPVRFLD